MLDKNSPNFVQTGGLLSCSQKLASFSYSEPEKPHPCRPVLFLKYGRTSNNGHFRGIQILSVIGGVR
jgi:hypothetical protein